MQTLSANPKRLGILVVTALLLLGLAGAKVAVSSADANTPQIVYDEGVGVCDPDFVISPCFGPPNTGLSPGDQTTLQVTVAQNDPQADGTIAITWPAGALKFQTNGDLSAVCTATNHSVSCSYTDFAHGYKSDAFTFKIRAGAPQTITAAIAATTSDGTSDPAFATLTLKPVPKQTFLSQSASPNVTLGGSISDAVTLSGGANPTGKIVVQLFGPNVTTCSNVPATATFKLFVNGDGTYTTPAYTPRSAGDYYWSASYSGDPQNLGSDTGCGGTGGSVVVLSKTRR